MPFLGTFGYLYQTEDGIVSSARGDPSGKIQGTFSYTDPTGLKVNINYNAGSRFDHRQNAQSASPTAQGYYNNAPARNTQEYEDDGQYNRSVFLNIKISKKFENCRLIYVPFFIF